MKNISLIFLAITIILCGCENTCTNINSNTNSGFGGMLKINESQVPKTLYPPAADDIASSQLIAQIYDGLVKYDPKNLSVIPAIANRWDIDKSKTVYTFYLNSNVFFHDDDCFKNGKGRQVKADDFKFTFELLATQSADNKNFFGTIDKIKGATQYYEASAKGKPSFNLEGIKVINDTTLQITIEQSNPLFIYSLALPAASVLPKEAIEKYGVKSYIGTGAFKALKPLEISEAIYLVRNNNYYRKDKKNVNLPYLDTIKVSFISATVKELEAFENGQIDIVMALPNKYVTQFFEKNKEKFSTNPPYFIMKNNDDGSNFELYNLLRSNVQNFYTNNLNYIDLSIVYFEEPKPITDEENKITQ